MKKKSIFLFALAIVLILATSISGALAYFTTYAEAQGGHTIELGFNTDIDAEGFSAWTNHVIVINNEYSQPVYVRAKAFAGSAYQLIYFDESGYWGPRKKDSKNEVSSADDGYYYYSDILYGGQETTELLVRIENIPTADTQSNDNMLYDGFSFNMVVIYEVTPVLYDEDGNPYADWSVTLDSGSTSGEGGNN